MNINALFLLILAVLVIFLIVSGRYRTAWAAATGTTPTTKQSTAKVKTP